MMTNVDGHECVLLNPDDSPYDAEVEVDGSTVGYDIKYLRVCGYVDKNDVITEAGFADLCIDAIDSVEEC